MPTPDSSNIIVALISALIGGGGVAILNYFLNRRKTEAEVKKMIAETDKIYAEIKNLPAAVSYSLSDSNEQIIFDGTEKIDGHDVKGKEGQFWTGRGKEAKSISEKGQGILKFEGGVLNLHRTNKEGRFELFLQRYIYNGTEHSAIPIDELISGKRKLRVSCEAKAIGAEHTLRFVFRNPKTGFRFSDEFVKVAGNEWTAYQVYLQSDPTQEAELRIDDENVSVVPSSVQIRKLVVAERKTSIAKTS
jgi:hypothetical protein